VPHSGCKRVGSNTCKKGGQDSAETGASRVKSHLVSSAVMHRFEFAPIVFVAVRLHFAGVIAFTCVVCCML
jgi:hypothetical protein